MNYYCTLFDSVYLSKGLAMYESLKANAKEFHLLIFAFDNLSLEILKMMDPDSVTVISLADFESPELLSIKGTRTKAEYCWTCTPSVISYSIEKFNLLECTYIDADLFFYSDPEVLINEMRENKKGVLITEHRFSLLPGWHALKRAGRFCVQFLTVKNDPASLSVLEQWRGQCIDWCYARYEDGKFGDQKYLEEWPEKYDIVHILNNYGGGIAPWNIGQYYLNPEEGRIRVTLKKDGNKYDAVFYHFQYVKLISENYFDIGWYHIPGNVKNILYKPYLEKLVAIEKRLKELNQGYNTIFTMTNTDNLRDAAKATFKKSTNYNILKII